MNLDIPLLLFPSQSNWSTSLTLNLPWPVKWPFLNFRLEFPTYAVITTPFNFTTFLIVYVQWIFQYSLLFLLFVFWEKYVTYLTYHDRSFDRFIFFCNSILSKDSILKLYSRYIWKVMWVWHDFSRKRNDTWSEGAAIMVTSIYVERKMTLWLGDNADALKQSTFYFSRFRYASLVLCPRLIY